MICTLTGMDVANASMYDGATALAEAALMACGAVKRKSILISRAVSPDSREVIETYTRFRGCKVEEFGFTDGRIDVDELNKTISSNTAAVILQSPNFFGIVEDIEQAAGIAHQNGALLIVSCDPISLALLKPPGELGADIVVGEGQSLGSPLCFGGPYLGFFATKKELMRKMPGRIVGMTEDHNGRRGFVLTLQAREQHIRREKATSNICSNQALNALAAAIYLSTLGKQGLKEVALQCMRKAHYAFDRLIETGAFTPVFDAPFFMEFTLKYRGDVFDLNRKLLKEKIIGGYDLGSRYDGMKNVWLLAVTEKRTRAEIDNLARKAADI
jgi:glycine dehydrogenase subunit 1